MTKIEWTEKTWNPIVGCTKVSPGCAHCYAEVMARRLKGMGRPEYQDVINGNGRWSGRVTLVPERLEAPLKRKKPTVYFVNSMSDLFHEDVPDEWIAKIFAAMRQADWHTFQVLTKRPEQALKILMGKMIPHVINSMAWADYRWPLLNVWLGTTVESAAHVDRLDYLKQIPAAVRFVSFEPLLDDVAAALTPEHWLGIDWAIIGGESGPHARPMHPDWARALRDQCQAAVVPFFFKQHGEWSSDAVALLWSGLDHPPDNVKLVDGEWMAKIGKKAAGRLLDGREWNEIPERITQC